MEDKKEPKSRINKTVVAVALILGVALGGGTMLSLPLLNRTIKARSQSQPIEVSGEVLGKEEKKKRALSEFYSKISAAYENQDWATAYELVPQSTRDNLTKEQFIARSKSSAEKEKAIVSQRTVVNSIVVDGDNGTVDRTITTCLTKECTGDGRIEDNAKKRYVYVNGKWQMPDPKPSDRALEIASYIYTNSPSDTQKTFKDDWGSASFATRNIALYFDQYPEKLALAEAWVDKDKANRSRPVVNYQPPAIVLPPIDQQPVIQQPSFPRHCTSNAIGNYTYTNCY